MIELRGIARRFVQGHGRSARAVQAVDGLDWVAGDGCISGLLGPNGAGKTTLLRIVAGLVEPDAGQVLVDGIDVATQRRQALARVGVLSDARGLYPRLTALENIVYYGRLHGLSLATAEARAHSLARTLQMEPLLQRRTEGFSQGERMKTALARALVHDPHNIILDEPTNGLDVPATRALREALATAARRARQVHRLFHPPDAGGGAFVRPGAGHGPRPRGGTGHGGRAVRKDRTG